MMNNANEISKKTKLYGFIGEHAGVSRFSTLINKMFKEHGDDAMMIPMNIREDDFYFTLSNMKKSHVDGAVISNEYVSRVIEVLDETSSLVKRSGMCDIVFKEGEKLRGDLFGMRVLLEHLKDLRLSKIALIGTTSHAKAFSFLSCGFEVSYFGENLEELMQFCEEVEIKDGDLNRLAKGLNSDLSGFDAVLDFSNMRSLESVEILPLFNFDMKNNKEYSPLKSRAHDLGAEYTSYDDMIEIFAQKAYKTIKGN
ncbi:MAG: hypothetical protein NTW78_06605 [Campylobacterales bacterium]|nr:hypothetical protein [Campylobacterales bacterium]